MENAAPVKSSYAASGIRITQVNCIQWYYIQGEADCLTETYNYFAVNKKIGGHAGLVFLSDSLSSLKYRFL
jgi:hypothetical protein